MRTAEKLRLEQAMREGLDNGTIIEVPLEGKKNIWHGFYSQEKDVVLVDPMPSTLDTVFHELLHRKYPQWTERRVRSTAHRLLSAMSNEERRTWYRAYKKRAKKSRRPQRME